MRPHHVKEEARRFDPSVGSSSNDRDLIGGPLVAMNFNRYNFLTVDRD